MENRDYYIRKDMDQTNIHLRKTWQEQEEDDGR
jgi:hypothetical protein